MLIIVPYPYSNIASWLELLKMQELLFGCDFAHKKI